MAKSEDRSSKFEWQPGEVKLILSQCSNCENNKGAIKCTEYGSKPNKYLDNKEICPAHIKE